MIEQARKYASQCHRDTNHLYDGMPYTVHLASVSNVAERFKHLIPSDDWETVVAACWCHDLIEDTRQTYNDVKCATNEQVAEIVYALTNEKGKNRKERANDKYYAGIKDIPHATFVKLCDRIANVEYSIEQNSRMAYLYKKEKSEFIEKLYDERYLEMTNYLVDILRPVGGM